MGTQSVDQNSDPITHYDENGNLIEIELPPVDMSRPDLEILPLISYQCKNLGFLHINNVPGYDEQKLYSMVKRFHGKSDEEKHALKWKNHNPNNTNIYRGLSPFLPNDPSHKELFDMGLPYEQVSEAERKYKLHEETPFYKSDPELKAYYEEQYQHRLQLGLRLARLLALDLGQKEDYFTEWFETDSLSTFRSIYYKPRSACVVDSSQMSQEHLKLTTPEHSDSGFITILATFGFPGLQVLHKGEYVSVRPSENGFVVNLGDAFSRMTGGRFKATKHRVLDIGQERYSQPFFFDPKYSTVITGRGLGESPREKEYNFEKYTTSGQLLTYGAFVIRKMVTSYKEWEGFDISDAENISDAETQAGSRPASSQVSSVTRG